MKFYSQGLIIVVLVQSILGQQTIQSSKLYSCIQSIQTPCSGIDTVCQVDYGNFGQCYVACASSTISLPTYEQCIQDCIKKCPNQLVQSFGYSILKCYSTNYSYITKAEIIIILLLIILY